MLKQAKLLTFDNLLLSQPIISTLDSDSALHENVRSYVEDAFATNTRKAYRLDLEHFATWGGVVPSTPLSIAQYIASQGGILAPATIARRLVAIGKAHTIKGLPNPCTTDLVRATYRGIRRTHETAQRQANPLLVQDLLSVLDRTSSTLKDVRDRALLLVGFAGAFRRAELVGLNVPDLEYTAHGLVVALRRSKVDQEAHGRKVGIPLARGRHCPVLSLQEWLATASISDGPVFRPVDRHSKVAAHRLSTQAVSTVVKERVATLGLNPSQYSGHSLRAGLATSAALLGLPSWKIRQQTGHASDAMLSRYIRDGELFRGNVAGSLL